MANAGVVKVLARRFGVGQWSFIGPGSEKKWYSAVVHKEPGIILRKKCSWNLQEADILPSVQRLHCPRGFAQSKGQWKTVDTLRAADEHTIETIFRIILPVNQLIVYGAVAAFCEEVENHQDESGEPDVLMGQSIVLGEIKAEVPLQNENPLNHQILWKQYIETN